MISAYDFYKLQKEDKSVEKVFELRKTIEMLTEVNKSIKLDSTSDSIFTSSKIQCEKPKSVSKGQNRPKDLKLNKTRERPSLEKSVAKRPRLSKADNSERGNEPELVEEPVVEDQVINSLDMGEKIFNFLLYPVSITDFGIDFYGLKPLHSVGGEARCNLNAILPVQKIDILVSTKRLYFGKDIQLINGSSNFTGRAYRPKIWSEFADGASVRFLLPERYFIKFGVEMGLLQEILNGPLYSTVNFLSKSFSDSLVDFTSPNCPPGDIFIIILENKLTVKATPSQDRVTNGEVKGEVGIEMRYTMKAGDMLYLPSFYSHEVTLDGDCEHAIVLCIVNRTPVLIRNWGDKLLQTLNRTRPISQKGLFRELLEISRNPAAQNSYLYVDFNSPGKIFDGVQMWMLGEDATFNDRVKQIVKAAIIELQKEIMCRSPSMWLHFSERNSHVSIHGAYWQDPNYDSDHEDEETVGLLLQKPDRPRLQGSPCLEDLELDLRSSIRVSRRSALCVVDEDPNDPQHIRLYHTFNNSIDARDENELSSVKFPRDDLTLSMVRRLVNYYPQSVIIDELAKGSEKEKTQVVHALFDEGLVVATSLWEQDISDVEEEDDMEGMEEEGEFDEEEKGRSGALIDLEVSH